MGAVSCRTYRWASEVRDVRGSDPEYVNPLNEARLRAAIAANLESHAVMPGEHGAPADCAVGYGLGVHTVIENGYMGGGWGWGWHHHYAGGWWDAPYVYQQGVIAVDLYDAHSHEPIWHASVNQNLAGLTGKAAESKINDAVAAIFTKYPFKNAQTP